MTAGDEYRVRAAELHAKAESERNPQTRAELEHMARSYVRLAEQADRNARLDVTYDTPAAQPNAQQQQQPQPKDDD